MTAREEHERFGHLARLGWDLRGLGYDISLVMPAAGSPVPQLLTRTGTKFHITAAACEWARRWLENVDIRAYGLALVSERLGA